MRNRFVEQKMMTEGINRAAETMLMIPANAAKETVGALGVLIAWNMR